MAYEVPRTLVNRAGVSYDATKTSVIFAEDMNKLKDNDAYLKAQIELSLSNGWTVLNQSWAYASANSITVPSGAQSIFQKGDKIKFTQHSVVKYMYVTGVTDTVLTVHAGSTYSIENTSTYPITLIYISHQENPNGFPAYFPLGTPTWTTNATAFTNQPSYNAWQFSIKGNICKIWGTSQCHATSNGTGVFFAVFPSGQLPTLGDKGIGGALNISTVANYGWCFADQTNTILLANYANTTLATSAQYFLGDTFFSY